MNWILFNDTGTYDLFLSHEISFKTYVKINNYQLDYGFDFGELFYSTVIQAVSPWYILYIIIKIICVHKKYRFSKINDDDYQLPLYK